MSTAKEKNENRVRDVFAKYGFLELLKVKTGDQETELVRAVASEVGYRNNFSHFRAMVKDHVWPYATNGAYREVLHEMSKDLHC